jgi:hypothetical protein
MIKIILTFLIAFGLFFIGIKTFREMNNKEKWELTVYLGYATICALLTLASLVLIVTFF